jgi:hypothetical protein
MVRSSWNLFIKFLENSKDSGSKKASKLAREVAEIAGEHVDPRHADDDDDERRHHDRRAHHAELVTVQRSKAKAKGGYHRCLLALRYRRPDPPPALHYQLAGHVRQVQAQGLCPRQQGHEPGGAGKEHGTDAKEVPYHLPANYPHLRCNKKTRSVNKLGFLFERIQL